MRAAPPYRVSIKRFGQWRSALVMLAASAVVTLSAWLVTRSQPIGWAIPVATALSIAAIVALTASLLRTGPVDLRWDGRAWWLDRGRGEPVPGDLVVAIDLGGWMLLRFHPLTEAKGRGTHWLPVQRRGLEPHWHGLRCSVYSPQPLPEDDAATAL